MADFWNHLVNTALLGTDKQAFDESFLPETIRNIFTQIDKKDKEALFYKVAALASQYQKAGRMPERPELLPAKPCEPEIQSYAIASSIAVLRKIFSYENGNQSLIENWMDKCIRKSWIITPELLLILLNLGLDKKYKHLQPLIKQLVGKRGLWLVQFNPEWEYLKELDYYSIWEDGKATDRKTALEYIRKENPTQARELLEISWKQETAKAKLELISILKINLSNEDEPFLQRVFDEIQIVRQKKKDATPDLLKQVVELLLSLPDSQLSQEIWEKTRKYITRKVDKKLLGLVSSESIVLSLPEKEDEYLSKANMWERLGLLEESHSKDTYSDMQGWLYELIARIPPARWQEYLGMTAVEIMDVFNKGEGFTKKKNKSKEENKVALYTVAIAQAADLHKDNVWALAWINHFKDIYAIQQTMVSHLYHYLSNQELEEFYLKYIDLANTASDSQNIRDVLIKRQEHKWSFAFTQYVVKALCADLKSYNYGHTVAFLNQAIMHMHPDIVKENITDYMSSDVQSWVKSQYERTIVYPLQEMMSLRLELEKAFEEAK